MSDLVSFLVCFYYREDEGFFFFFCTHTSLLIHMRTLILANQSNCLDQVTLHYLGVGGSKKEDTFSPFC